MDVESVQLIVAAIDQLREDIILIGVSILLVMAIAFIVWLINK